MSIRTSLLPQFAVILCLFIAADAYAQMGGGSKGGRGRADRSPPADVPMRPSSGENLVELTEYRLVAMEEDLRLTPAQQKTFTAYADKVRAIAADIARDRTRPPSGPQPTMVQQADRAVAIARNRMTALEDIAGSAKVFYEGLLPEQKLLADSRFATIMPLIAGTAVVGTPPATPYSLSAPAALFHRDAQHRVFQARIAGTVADPYA
jgi:hypothetical protein